MQSLYAIIYIASSSQRRDNRQLMRYQLTVALSETVVNLNRIVLEKPGGDFISSNSVL